MKKYLFFSIVLIIAMITVSAEESGYGPPIETQDYTLSRSKVDRSVVEKNILDDFVEVYNNRNSPITLRFEAQGEVDEYIGADYFEMIIDSKNTSRWDFRIIGLKSGNAEGILKISGDISEELPINITITKNSLDPLIIIGSNLEKNSILLNKDIRVKIDIIKIKSGVTHNLTLGYLLKNEANETRILGNESFLLVNSLNLLREFSFEDTDKEGFYTLRITGEYNNRTIVTENIFKARISFLQRKLFGIIPVWAILGFATIIFLIVLTLILIKKHIESKKKYKMTLDIKSLPKKDKEFLWFGKIAEKKNEAYYDPNKLTTHCIVAGATGGGKSIAAQVIIEEALKQDIAVIVIDPTAQWSGMLRKLEDKKMFTYYAKFGMKKKDARGFPGNIRAIKDARQIIDVSKNSTPGHIQIFTLNKLQPKEMDIFVANLIRGIFKSDPKEFPTLRTLLVFDEVHRLLPKFGGSGEGFLQIERSCREFRKWGYGVMLISQVLNDFVGEIKANISTEVQMRTRDEGDLERIKTKFGEEFLQSLVKASVGVGMFVNPSYNHAQPYFINFRPILHNTRRLSDEELEKYNQYNDQVEDLEFQTEELEKEKIDVFDLKMELKLVKDKIMVGNFSVVDIYLEGLKPRMAKQWEKLGKKAPERKIELADLDEIKKSVEEAKKESEKAKAKEASSKKAVEEVKDPIKEMEEALRNPITFDNGLMVSSLKELKSVLPNLDIDIFKIHVNEQKNEIADWFKGFAPVFAARLKSIKDKEELVKEINLFKGDEMVKAPPKESTTKPSKSTNKETKESVPPKESVPKKAKKDE